jgi:ABC-type multidrug transport system permease subunit
VYRRRVGGTTLLALRGLGKDYGERAAVGAVDLEVPAGSIFGLLGPNGAGKTTTISMIAGVITPSRGKATVGGHQVVAGTAGFAARRATGLVPQDLALYEELTADQNLAFFGRLYGLDRATLGVKRTLRDVDAFQLAVPGNAVLFGFFLALTVGLAFLEERRWGTWRRLLAAPVPRWRILLAKLVPYALVGLAQYAFLFGLGAGVFGMRVGGSVVALVAMSVAVVLCAVSLGLAISSLGGTEKRLGSIGSVCLLVMGLIGGAMVPRAIMPPAMQTVGLAVPHGWALDGFFTLLVRDGAGIVDVLPQIAGVLGFACAFAAFGVWRFRFER